MPLLSLLLALVACDPSTADAPANDTDTPPASETDETPLDVLDERGGLALADEGWGDGVTELVYLDQGWDPVETLWYYHADQGSTLVPRRVLVHLEQPDAQAAFLAADHVARLRFLPQRVSPQNPDGLPVGFARHEDAVGLTCAACHTTQLEVGDVGLRIDGAPAMATLDGLLEALADAIAATLDDAAKLGRYLDAATAGPPSPPDEERVVTEELEATLAWLRDYNRANHSDVAEGYGRIDAVGRIVNQVIRMTSGPENSVEPDAPNSIPFLWDTPRHDYVQWAGFGSNAGVGSLARNAGEVIGVFGQVEVSGATTELERLRPYPSTIAAHNLVDMESQLWRLRSPVWPEDLLPPIDAAKAARGASLYDDHCASCHALLDRDDEERRVTAQIYGLDQTGTDPTAAENFHGAWAPTGVLEGTLDVSGATFGETAHAATLLGTLVVRSLAGTPMAIAAAELHAQRYDLTESAKQGDHPADTDADPRASWLAYKARPLNGVWATGPFLHNGSVPSLYDLLLPPEERPVTFHVGRRTFDPVKVGPTQDGDAPFTLDTRLPGNSNAGHRWGTDLSDDERWDLVELLKTL